VVAWYVYDQAWLLYLSLINVIVAMLVAMRDFFVREGDSEQSTLVSYGMLAYVSLFTLLWWKLSLSPLLLAMSAIFGLFLLLSLWRKGFGRGLWWGILLLWVVWLWYYAYQQGWLWNAMMQQSNNDMQEPLIVTGDAVEDLSWAGVSGDAEQNPTTGAVIETGTLLSGVQATTPTEEKPVATPSKRVFATQTSNAVVTYANFLPLLQKRYQLTAKGNVAFTYVSKTNALYTPFLAAFNKGLIGVNANPTTQLKCKYIMTMIGLLEAPSLQKWSTNIHASYREYAKNRGYLARGCDQKDAIAQLTMLP
jgi:hypothetical protein